jgi:WD40 repeat protein
VWALSALAGAVLLADGVALGDEPRPDPAAKRLDRYGDPLPQGAVARLGTLRLRRSSASAFTPDGKAVVTHGYDELRVWELGTGKELKRFPSKGGCAALAVSPDGKLAALSREGGVVVDVVDLGTGKTVHHFQTREEISYRWPKCHSLAFSADGTRLHTSDDERGHVWDLTAGKAVSSFPHPADDKEKGVWIVAFSPDGKLLATGTQSTRAVRVWDAATGKMLHELKGDGGGIECAVFSPEGGVLAVANRDEAVEVWDASAGKRLRTLKGTGDRTVALAFSPDGSLLAAVANGGISSTATGLQQVVLWNVEAEEVVTRVPAPEVCGVRFSPDGKLLAWESGTAVGFIDATTGKHIHSYDAHTGPVTALAYSPDGKLIATGSEDGTVRVWNPDTGEPVGALRGHKDHVYAVAFSPDGKWLASGGRDHATAVWEVPPAKPAGGVAAGKPKWMKGGYGNSVTAVAFSPDGQAVAAGGRNFETVLRSATTGEPRQTLREDRLVTTALAFLPDGKHLAVGGSESVRVWDLKAARVVRALPCEARDVRSLAVSPDGRLAVAAGGKKTQVWDLGSGKVVATFAGQHNWIGGVAFSPDGTLLASVGDGLWGGEEYSLHVRDTKTWTEADVLRLPRERYTCLAFSPDGKRLAIGTVHAEALVWELKR